MLAGCLLLLSLVNVVSPMAPTVIVLRSVRLLSLLKHRVRPAAIANSLAILVPRLCSAAVVFVLLMYSFAVVGMESFVDAGTHLRNCCK